MPEHTHRLELSERTESGRWWTLCACTWSSGFHLTPREAEHAWYRHVAEAELVLQHGGANGHSAPATASPPVAADAQG